MEVLRTVTAIVGLMVLGGGYLASQAAYFSGTTAEYVAGLDASVLPWVCLGLVVLAVGLAFFRDGGAGGEADEEVEV